VRQPWRLPFTPPLPARRMMVTSQDGARLHVEIHGPDGAGVPTVVLVHGWTCSIPFWALVIEALRKELRVVGYDLRGHGVSDPPVAGQCSSDMLAGDLSAVLDAVLGEGQQAVLAGHSMGGMTVMAGALHESVIHRTSGVLLASTGYGGLHAEALVVPLRRSAPRLSAALHHLLLTSAAPMGSPTPVSRAMLRYMTLGPGASEDLAARNAAIIHSCGRRPRAAWGRVLAGLDLTAAVSRLDVPTQVLVGSADRLTPPVHARRIADRLPRCEGLTQLPGVGHMTPLEAPDVVAAMIRKLAAGGDSAGRDSAGRDSAG
jgi:pimeloyl-ACP methyl ester carboxylesterase